MGVQALAGIALDEEVMSGVESKAVGRGAQVVFAGMGTGQEEGHGSAIDGAGILERAIASRGGSREVVA